MTKIVDASRLCGPLALVLVVLTLVLGQQRPAPVPSNTWDQLKVRDLRIVDDQGRELFRLGHNEDGEPVLALYDSQQRLRAMLRLDSKRNAGEAELTFYGQDARPLYWLGRCELNIGEITSYVVTTCRVDKRPVPRPAHRQPRLGRPGK